MIYDDIKRLCKEHDIGRSNVMNAPMVLIRYIFENSATRIEFTNKEEGVSVSIPVPMIFKKRWRGRDE